MLRRPRPRPSARRSTLPAFAAGALLAITAVAIAGSTPDADATTSSGERPVFIPIEPCRLADTRPPSQVGDRGTPLGGEETAVFAARGDVGECEAVDLPDDALGLVLNVTAIGASSPTFLAVFPGGTPPTSSSLNPVPGQPPTPNAVSVRLADDGSFSVFNRFGTVDVIIDVVGHYRDHDHDDRYDTSAEVDAKIVAGDDQLLDALTGTSGPVKVNGRDIQANKNELEQTRRVQVNRFDFHPVQTDNGARRVGTGAYVPTGSPNNQLWAAVTIPTGATVTGVQARYVDDTANADLEVRFYQVSPSGVRQEVATTMTSSGSSGAVRTLTGAAAFPNTLESSPLATYEVRVQAVNGSSWTIHDSALQIVGFFVDYEFEVEPVL